MDMIGITADTSISRRCLPSEVDVLIVLKDYRYHQSHKDFRVRRSVVQDALTYLIENNKYYRANAICLNQEALQQLLNYYLSLIQSLSCTHMTCQKLVSNYTHHWHPHSLRSPKWRLRHSSTLVSKIRHACAQAVRTDVYIPSTVSRCFGAETKSTTYLVPAHPPPSCKSF